MGVIAITILLLLLYALCYGLSALFFWGLGCLIIYVFGISYTWTFLHGLVVSIVISVLTGIFKSNDKE